MVRQEGLSVVCLGAIPPGSLGQARYLCKRLRRRFPDIRIVVARWRREGGSARSREILLSAGADHVGFTLRETRDMLMPFLELLPPTFLSRSG